MIFAGYKPGLGCILAGRGDVEASRLAHLAAKTVSCCFREKRSGSLSTHITCDYFFCESSAEWSGVYVRVAFSIRVVGLRIPCDRKILVILQRGWFVGSAHRSSSLHSA